MARSKNASKDVKWEVLETKELLRVDSRLTVSVQKLKLPDGRIVDEYYRVIFPDSVVIIALTREKKVVMSRQYLHGFGRTSIVLPAGTMDKGETPLRAAKRELLEETGYASDNWKFIEASYSNTNYVGAKVSFFLAGNARKVAEPDSHDLEEMEIVLLSEAEIIESVRDQSIISLGTIAGLSMAKAHLRPGPARKKIHRA